VNFQRASGILLHPTSLPGRYGIGDLGGPARSFLDFLTAAQQTLWQLLPLGPTGYGDSPYQCFSAFAGNPLLVSLEELAADGLLAEEDLRDPPAVPDDRVDYGAVIPYRSALLARAAERFHGPAGRPLAAEFDRFCRKQRHWLDDFALFVAFFPQLVAGPIVRAIDFLPQLDAKRLWNDVRVRSCLTLFLVGFVKKACVSDNVVQLVDPYFAHPEQYDALGAWTATLYYAAQIYCDFSGYSDMAIAVAGLLGYELRVNFEFPYLAASIKDFWRRWHISLSSWLRDYLYIPLGGNRGSAWFARRNLMLTMLLGGLWHGAGWNFVIWGGLHGLALVVHRVWESGGRRLPAALGMALTFWWVCLAWIFFRAESLASAWTTVQSFVALRSPGVESWGLVPLATFALLAGAHALGSTHAVARWTERLALPAYATLYGVAFACAFAFMNGAVQPFIYFQF